MLHLKKNPPYLHQKISLSPTFAVQFHLWCLFLINLHSQLKTKEKEKEKGIIGQWRVMASCTKHRKTNIRYMWRENNHKNVVMNMIHRNEGMNTCVAKYAPKTRTYAKSCLLETRVKIAAGIYLVSYHFFWPYTL